MATVRKVTKLQRGEAWIVAKASKHKKFRKELLASPEAVIERETGAKLPRGVRVQVLEDKPKLKHLVLPVKPKVPDVVRMGGKLTDGELLAMLRGSDEGPIGLCFCPWENDNI